MNGAALALLGGAAVLAVVASSSSDSGGGNDGELKLVADSRDMVAVFELYSRKLEELSDEEVEKLSQLNAAAKGFGWAPPQVTIQKMLKAIGDPVKAKPVIERFWIAYKRNYLLPPGVNEESGPDMFSEWASPTPGKKSKNFWAPIPIEFRCINRNYAINGADIGCYNGIWYDFFERNCGSWMMDTTIHGKSDLLDITNGLREQFGDLWQSVGGNLLKAVANIASNYPGIGTAIAVGATFLEQVGSGASLEDAALNSARSAIPSALRSAYDIGVGIATRGELDVEAALSVAMAAAISQGAVTGDVLEYYNTIKNSYERAKESVEQVTGGLETISTIAEVATT